MYHEPSATLTNQLTQLPWRYIGIITLICCIGIGTLYSAAGGSWHPWAIRQLFHMLVFLPIMVMISLVPISFLFRASFLIYLGTLGLLIIVEITGHTAMGATRWINLGFFKLQPSELMKLALIFALARYFHSLHFENIRHPLYLVPPLCMVLIPTLLILKQPDLGTATVLLNIGGLMFFLAGVRIWKFAAMLSLILAALPIMWHFMHDYQKKRIDTFLHPERDPLGAGYNILQSKIAIGSGGFWGKGMMQGTQSQLQFLPEHHTDFIFTMFAEEHGLLGSLALLSLFAFLIGGGVLIALRCQTQFGRLLAGGATGMLWLHVSINMAMVMGLVPVVGVPLPLMSYGGTMMMTILVAFGLVLNAHSHSRTELSRGWETMMPRT